MNRNLGPFPCFFPGLVFWPNPPFFLWRFVISRISAKIQEALIHHAYGLIWFSGYQVKGIADKKLVKTLACLLVSIVMVAFNGFVEWVSSVVGFRECGQGAYSLCEDTMTSNSDYSSQPITSAINVDTSLISGSSNQDWFLSNSCKQGSVSRTEESELERKMQELETNESVLQSASFLYSRRGILFHRSGLFWKCKLQNPVTIYQSNNWNALLAQPFSDIPSTSNYQGKFGKGKNIKGKKGKGVKPFSDIPSTSNYQGKFGKGKNIKGKKGKGVKEASNTISSNPKIPIKALQDQVQRKFHINISKIKAYKAKEIAVKNMRNDYHQKYVMLRDYAMELKERNMDTTVNMSATYKNLFVNRLI
ncbi:transposase, mutator type, MULE transposase domain protein [Artemisia annua]|uniref:Transposase, mutator type, MULE transposase domain protein n=1 Tax=Artemisia annua TaxID=35608 RepID=A0A2U1MHD9_ARTAN|nr:transposase, mutator type, MULE transposase domain protein [Artemisia annua]